MAILTIKDMPENLFLLLKEAAKNHQRSLDGEVIACLERALLGSRADAGTQLAKARTMRIRTAHRPITEQEFNEAKRAGRE